MTSSIPSKLVFLSDLPNLQDRDKVRFLGCVEYYDIQFGYLLLKHSYPDSTQKITASVDLDHVRENLEGTALQVGAWVNVVGYIMNGDLDDYEARGKKGARDVNSKNIRVQAIMMWEAAGIKVDEYEKAVQARKDTGTAG